MHLPNLYFSPSKTNFDTQQKLFSTFLKEENKELTRQLSEITKQMTEQLAEINELHDAEINRVCAELEKEVTKKEKQKFVCPYGCGKTCASKHCLGAKKHLLKCGASNRNQGKLSHYFRKKT